jgi:hypothetical protein
MYQLQAQIDRYTTWLRMWLIANEVSIEPTSDRGACPYQWKLSGEGGLRHYGYLIFDGPIVNGTDEEKKAELYSRLKTVLATAE